MLCFRCNTPPYDDDAFPPEAVTLVGPPPDVAVLPTPVPLELSGLRSGDLEMLRLLLARCYSDMTL